MITPQLLTSGLPKTTFTLHNDVRGRTVLFATQCDGRINADCEREDDNLREFGRLAGLAKNEPLGHSNLSIGAENNLQVGCRLR